MNLNKVLSAENNGKSFVCKANGCLVKNIGRVLYYLSENDEFKVSITSHIWVNAEYSEID